MIGLGLAIVVSVALSLHLTRGTTFGPDEYWYFVVNRGFDIKGVLSAHNGNLIAVVRLIYATVFALFGPDYVVFRILEVLGTSVAAILFFVLVRRRVGAVAGLAFTVPLLFLGAAPDVTLSPLGIAHVYAVVFGLGGLLALESRWRHGGVAACILLSLSMATFSLGLAFVAAAAVSVLLHENWRRRAYIFLIPVALYVAWKVAAPQYTGPGYLSPANLQLSNVRLIPGFVSRAAAAATAAVSGLNYPFGTPIGGLGVLEHYGVGFVLAGVGVLLLGARVVRRKTSRSLWPFVALPLAFWISIVMVTGINRSPNSTRYLYMGGIAVLLVAAEGIRDLRWRPTALVAVVALSAVSVGFNVAELRTDAAGLRQIAAVERSEEAAMELARGHVRSNLLPPALSFTAGLVNIGGGVRPYLRAVGRYGSPAYSVTTLRQQPNRNRLAADVTLASAIGLSLTPAPPHDRHCGHGHGGNAGASILRVRPPGVILISMRGGPVHVGRFADRPLYSVGVLRPGVASALYVPGDRAADPWRLAPPPGPLVACAI